MKPLLALTLLLAAPLYAQSRILIGATGSDSFNNESFGPNVELEVPFAKRYELDLRDTFSPIQTHIGLGNGRSNIARAGGIVWLNRAIGLTSNFEQSRYSAPGISKTGYDVFAGSIFRFVGWEVPVRFELDYVREVLNKMHNGDEPSRLQAFNAELTVRLGCAGPFCFRARESISVGRVLTQGNPQCDGEGMRNPALLACPRKAASGGGFTAGFMIEWPRPKGKESDVF